MNEMSEDLRDLVRELIVRYTKNGGCGWCGGLPHSKECLVGRMEVALLDKANPIPTWLWVALICWAHIVCLLTFLYWLTR
jgi:hypothetical protein